MSAAKKPGRFGYLSQQETPSTVPAAPDTPDEEERTEQAEEQREDLAPSRGGGVEASASASTPESYERPSISPQSSSSLPKGQGRMKQERSQLNVRIPTPLKRQASAKAILEGRDIGEIVEELLREYVAR